jgi:hypothetical protein
MVAGDVTPIGLKGLGWCCLYWPCTGLTFDGLHFPSLAALHSSVVFPQTKLLSHSEFVQQSLETYSGIASPRSILAVGSELGESAWYVQIMHIVFVALVLYQTFTKKRGCTHVYAVRFRQISAERAEANLKNARPPSLNCIRHVDTGQPCSLPEQGYFCTTGHLPGILDTHDENKASGGQGIANPLHPFCELMDINDERRLSDASTVKTESRSPKRTERNPSSGDQCVEVSEAA